MQIILSFKTYIKEHNLRQIFCQKIPNFNKKLVVKSKIGHDARTNFFSKFQIEYCHQISSLYL